MADAARDDLQRCVDAAKAAAAASAGGGKWWNIKALVSTPVDNRRWISAREHDLDFACVRLTQAQAAAILASSSPHPAATAP